MRRVRKLTPFGEAVKKRAVEKDITITELAGVVGTSVGYLSRILSGERPGHKYKEAIIKTLDMPEHWLRSVS